MQMATYQCRYCMRGRLSREESKWGYSQTGNRIFLLFWFGAQTIRTARAWLWCLKRDAVEQLTGENHLDKRGWWNLLSSWLVAHRMLHLEIVSRMNWNKYVFNESVCGLKWVNNTWNFWLSDSTVNPESTCCIKLLSLPFAHETVIQCLIYFVLFIWSCRTFNNKDKVQSKKFCYSVKVFFFYRDSASSLHKAPLCSKMRVLTGLLVFPMHPSPRGLQKR